MLTWRHVGACSRQPLLSHAMLPPVANDRLLPLSVFCFMLFVDVLCCAMLRCHFSFSCSMSCQSGLIGRMQSVACS